MKLSYLFLLPVYLIVGIIGNAMWYDIKRDYLAGILADKQP